MRKGGQPGRDVGGDRVPGAAGRMRRGRKPGGTAGPVRPGQRDRWPAARGGAHQHRDEHSGQAHRDRDLPITIVLAPDDKMAYVVNEWTNTVMLISTTTNTAGPPRWLKLGGSRPLLARPARCHKALVSPTSSLESIPADIRQLFDDRSRAKSYQLRVWRTAYTRAYPSCCGTATSETNQESTQEGTSQIDNRHDISILRHSHQVS
jgi:hypothetical protein